MKAIVLVSGGIDSAVALWAALSEGHSVQGLTFNYFRRPPGEVSAGTRLAESAGGIPIHAIDLPFMREVVDMPLRSQNRNLDSAPEGYISARNLIFYGLALAEAEARGAELIVGGHNGGDSEVFPDASPLFFRSLNRISKMALWSSKSQAVKIETPLSGMTKSEVINLGVGMGVPLELTWSCYWDGDRHCGTCESCIERRTAFVEAGIGDPTQYSFPPRSGRAPQHPRRSGPNPEARGS